MEFLFIFVETALLCLISAIESEFRLFDGMVAPMKMRIAQENDAELLAGFARRTFSEAFSHNNNPEDMALYMAEAFQSEKQRAEILDPARRTMLAFEGDQLAGYYQLRAGQAEPCVKGPNPIELLRLYVDARWHGKGIAALLMENAIERARMEGFATLWLGVWDQNPRAMAFYKKWGFAEVGSHGFQLGNDAQTDLVYSRAI